MKFPIRCTERLCDGPVPELDVPPPDGARVPRGGDGERGDRRRLALGEDGVDPVQHEPRGFRERPAAQAGPVQDAVGRGPERQERERQHGGEEDDREWEPRRVEDGKSNDGAEEQPCESDEGRGAERARLLDQRLVEDGGDRVDGDAGRRWEPELERRGEEAQGDDRHADRSRPPPIFRQSRRGGDQQQRNDIEEIAVTNDVFTAEAEVERRRLDGEHHQREERKRREAVAAAAFSRTRDRGEEPAPSEEEGDDAASDPDDGDMPSCGAPRARRQDPPTLHRDGVGAPQPVTRAGDHDARRHDRCSGVQRPEQTVAAYPCQILKSARVA